MESTFFVERCWSRLKPPWALAPKGCSPRGLQSPGDSSLGKIWQNRKIVHNIGKCRKFGNRTKNPMKMKNKSEIVQKRRKMQKNRKLENSYKNQRKCGNIYNSIRKPMKQCLKFHRKTMNNAENCKFHRKAMNQCGKIEKSYNKPGKMKNKSENRTKPKEHNIVDSSIIKVHHMAMFSRGLALIRVRGSRKRAGQGCTPRKGQDTGAEARAKVQAVETETLLGPNSQQKGQK